jgi:putative acetyltransferase
MSTPSAAALARPERTGDVAAIREIHEQAFGRAAEADLVDALRAHGKAALSLVAVRGERVAGHILFSPVTIESGGRVTAAVGLGPMAVLPPHQREGIGSLLVWAGLEACRQAGHASVVVLGHPAYYPRFGFVPATRHGLRWEHPAPDEAFMVLALRDRALTGPGGIVRYQPEFGGV